MLKTLVVIAAAGALAAGLLAQTPMKAAKPVTAVKAPVAPPTPAPAPQGGSANNQCRSTDLTGQWTSTRALMTRCLNKQITIGSETNSYNVLAVTDGGFELARVSIEGNGQGHNQKVTRFIPWSSVLYFATIGDFVDIVLVREPT
jgi:hypothetical protein